MSGLHAPASAGGHDVRVVDLGERWAAACLDCSFATLHKSATAAATSGCQHWQDSVHWHAASRVVRRQGEPDTNRAVSA